MPEQSAKDMKKLRTVGNLVEKVKSGNQEKAEEVRSRYEAGRGHKILYHAVEISARAEYWLIFDLLQNKTRELLERRTSFRHLYIVRLIDFITRVGKKKKTMKKERVKKRAKRKRDKKEYRGGRCGKDVR